LIFAFDISHFVIWRTSAQLKVYFVNRDRQIKKRIQMTNLKISNLKSQMVITINNPLLFTSSFGWGGATPTTPTQPKLRTDFKRHRSQAALVTEFDVTD